MGLRRGAKRFGYFAGSSPAWCVFWAGWSLAFFLFDWYVLRGALRWLGALQLAFFGGQLFWAGWRAFSPKGRCLREFAKEDTK